MSWGSQKGGEKNETVETFLDRRRCSRNGRTDLDYRWNINPLLWSEYKVYKVKKCGYIELDIQ